ncbi:transposase family protein (plasmid) [Burkholderia gladioli]|uniref:Transposase family protein n=2 Tax=Burkholderia gladioli TaxID=28095 RepID=A0AAW3F6P3_BURGA|nr:transposase family protein [Burkholderia gladioli]ASD84650.1 transposase [Burkholderia gladioli pv. gladioli]AWY49831.1 transposase [Burkholderia gladioli pv. gladioli]KGC16343.1 transposase family protein [Burkholderia gladioli]SPU96212.1 transposase IS3/IS911 family protein [Burkholderia gladioli]
MFNERGQVCMNEQDGGLQSRLVVDLKRDGRRKYDEDAKRELIQACLKPGVSIARTAMEHDINPNLVRTWISKYQREQAAGEIVSSATESSREARVELSTASVPEESAFMQVVTSAAAPTPAISAAVFSLNVHLPNGVSLELSQANFDELTILVQMLGRLPCSGSTKG